MASESPEQDKETWLDLGGKVVKDKARVLVEADDGGKLIISSNIPSLAISTAPDTVYGGGKKQGTRPFPKLALFTPSMITGS